MGSNCDLCSTDGRDPCNNHRHAVWVQRVAHLTDEQCRVALIEIASGKRIADSFDTAITS